MIFIFSLSISIFFSVPKIHAANSGDVVINEVYYVSSEDDEFIEIYNNTTGNIDISNYKIGDEEMKGNSEGMYKFPENTIINAGEFIIIARKSLAFENTFKMKANFEFENSDDGVFNMIKYTIWGTGSVNLANGGDEALLLDNNDNILDAVCWGSSKAIFNPSVALVAAGHSIERCPAGLDTNSATDFIDEAIPTPGQGVLPDQPPIAEAGPNQNITLGQTVNFDASGSYDSDGTIDSYSWDFDGDGEEDSNQVNPQYTYDTVGQFTATVTVTDDSGSISSDQAIINVSWPTYSSNIFINELLPNPSGDETTDEYVELFNNGNAAVDLVGWKVADASGSYYIISKKNYNSTVIPAKGYFTLYRNVTGVSLNNSGGEQIFFYSPDGNQKNSVSYSGSVSEDYSYNRTNNGWQWSTTSTPGSGNIITEEDPSNSSSSVKKAKTIKASSTKTSSGSTGSVLGVKKAQAAGNSSSHHFSENEDSGAVSASDRWRIFIWLLMIGAFTGLIVFRLLLWRKDRYKNDTIYQ